MYQFFSSLPSSTEYILLDTPCKAGARSVFYIRECIGLTEMITTFGRRHLRQFHKPWFRLDSMPWYQLLSKNHLFKKVAQNMIKTGPKPGPWTSVSQSLIQVLEGYFSVFFRTLKIHNSNYQGTATFRHPSYPLGKNQLLSVRTNERTNGRTDTI